MKSDLIHIVPFDIGCSFLDFEYSKKQSKDDFIEVLSSNCYNKGILIEKQQNNKYICTAKISDSINCYLLEYGVGVFVVKNLKSTDMTKFDKQFKNELACRLYYKKKYEQQEIRTQSEEEVLSIAEFMQITWNSVKKITRTFSASQNYKHSGLSYVMSIYHIIDSTKDYSEDKDIDMLMNPDILGTILKEEQWDSIQHKVENYSKKGYESFDFNDLSKVVTSWSAVAVIDENETDVIDKILDYEILLQGSWFLFDCLIDNIKNSKMSALDLQKEKSLVTNVTLEICNISSANMSTNEKNIMEGIYKTSGFDTVKEKLYLLLENRISIAEARTTSKQATYGIITEILLILFTLVSIFDPIKNFINGTLNKTDYIVAGIMLVVLIISTVLIIGKEK